MKKSLKQRKTAQLTNGLYDGVPELMPDAIVQGKMVLH